MGKRSKNLLDGEDKTIQITPHAGGFPQPPLSLRNPALSDLSTSTSGTFKVERSHLLSKLDSFLPQIKSANEELERVRDSYQHHFSRFDLMVI